MFGVVLFQTLKFTKMKAIAMKLFFVVLISFFPSFGKEIIIERDFLFDIGSLNLKYINHVFLNKFFGDDSIKIKKYLNTDLKKIVLINKEKQELVVLDFADTFRVILKTEISTGKKGYPTPCGEFKITKKRQSRISKKYGGTMTYWNCIVPDESIGIHGLENKLYEKNLGQPVSHGCIRISNSITSTFYEIASIGTLVLIE